jgi:hypothetical protein
MIEMFCLIAVGPDQVRRAKKPVRPAAIFIFGDGNLDIGNGNVLASGDYDVPHDEQQTLDSQWVMTDGENIAQFIGISASILAVHEVMKTDRSILLRVYSKVHGIPGEPPSLSDAAQAYPRWQGFHRNQLCLHRRWASGPGP